MRDRDPLLARSVPAGRPRAGKDSHRGTRPAALLVRVTVAALLAVLGVGAVTAAASGQESESGERTTSEAEVRIVARLLDDGRTEFGLQQRLSSGSWGERLLPDVRFFPADATVGRWLRSSPLSVTIEAGDAAATLRVVARELDDGRIEFGLQQRLSGGSWGERLLPDVRFFPAGATVGRWLRSSPLTVTATPAPPSEGGDDSTVATPIANGFTAVVAGYHHSCGLRTGGTLACWGENGWGQADPPGGTFRAVGAGEGHSCGLRSDSTITCWGNSSGGQADAPTGTFSAVSVGGSHSCGLRSNATITCWGHNWAGQTSVPRGDFTSVAAGGLHSCGLRSDATITCWGSNWAGQTDAPGGTFTALSAGVSHTCGLRDGGTVECWGSDSYGEAHAPQGQFSAVAAGRSHSCGLRANDTITCWGNNINRQASAPRGGFNAVSAGWSHSCGLRVDSTIACWGNDHRQINAPAGGFSIVSAGDQHSCGIRIDDTIACWGNLQRETDAPGGQFTAVAASKGHSCAIGADRTVACWGEGSWGKAEAPAGQFLSVSAGGTHSCAVRTDSTITCWGLNSAGQADAPAGQFLSVSAGGTHSCAVRTNDTITCWGENSAGQADAPAGQFLSVSAGGTHSCAIGTNDTITCWGYNANGQADAPAGQFLSVSAGDTHSCAIGTNDTITCWGYYSGLADPPAGSFDAVTAGYRHSCGLRTDATVVCWPLARTAPTPVGVDAIASADPAACRPHGLRNGISAGFPLPPSVVAATGTVRVAVLFLDFPDAVAEYSTRQEAESSLLEAELYLEETSYGILNIEFVPLHRWLRAENDHGHYAVPTAVAGQVSVGNVWELAVRLADPFFNFTGFDSAMVIMPSSHFGGGSAAGSVDTNEGTVARSTQINVFPYDEAFDQPLPWGLVTSHELGHTFGLVDYYPYDNSHELPEAPRGKLWANSVFGLMGLVARFLAGEREPLLSYTAHHPNGTRSTQHTNSLGAGEMLAWSRWQLGWLDAMQIRCITDTEATVSLTPVAAPGNGVAMAAIPLSDTEVIVMESRRKIGYDVGTEIEWADGGYATLPALGTEGVFVYTVDAALGTGELPLKIAGDPGNGQVDAYPILTEGESITIRGYTITVQSATATTHTVAIRKSAAT